MIKYLQRIPVGLCYPLDIVAVRSDGYHCVAYPELQSAYTCEKRSYLHFHPLSYVGL